MVLRLLAETLQLDKPLVYAMAAFSWLSLSGPITIVFLIGSLSLPEQGIYYSLLNVIGIQMFFELGLLSPLVSQAGHFVARLSSSSGQRRMREFIQASQQWFVGASVLFAVIALAIGWNMFVHTNSGLAWRLPLIALVLSSALVIAISPRLAILEGVGYRESIYRVRFLQLLTGNLVVWLALSLGFKLWTLVAASLVQLLWSVYVVCFAHGEFFGRLKRSTSDTNAQETQAKLPDSEAGEPSFSWTRDVLPVQWRLAVVSAVYHFATQFFTVIALRFHSASEAGQLGMTLSVTSAIQAMALACIQTKLSLLSAQHGAGDGEAAGTMWRQTAIVSTGLLLVAMSAAICIVALLPLANLGIENRFIQPWQMLILAVGCLANHLIALQGFDVLSRRSRPFMLASLIGFGSTALAVWVGGYLYSINGIVLGYTLTTVLIALPAHSFAYLAYRHQGKNSSDLAPIGGV